MELLDIHKLLITFMKDNKLLFLFYLIVSLLLYPIHYIFIPKYYGYVINSFKDKKESRFIFMVKALVFFYILCWFLETGILFLQYKIFPVFAEYATGTIFEFIIDHYELDFENIHTGEILSKIIRLPGILIQYMTVFGIEFFKEFFTLITAIYSYYNVSSLAVVVYLFYVILNYSYTYTMFRIFLNNDIAKNDVQDKMYEALVDCFNNFSSVYAFNQQEYEIERFYTKSYIGYKLEVNKSWEIYIKSYIFWGFVTVSMFLVMNYIIYNDYKKKKIDSDMLISTFIITFSIVRLYEKAEGSSSKYSEIFSKIMDTEKFFNTISDYNYNSKKVGDSVFKNGNIVIKNLYHKYDETFVLENINLTIKKGEKVAFVGHIGSGKSTLIKLILGFQPIVMGDIIIGDVNLNNVPNKDIRREIFYIPQKPKLFNRTLYENIVYGLEKPPAAEDIIKLLNDLELSDIAEIFSAKMNASVGVDGNFISGGQRQMVWLLRSFYRQSRILIMDEPTASLDQKNKDLLIKIIKKISIGKTVIIVSHDSIDPAFRKIEFNKGRLVTSSYFS
jgi:ABC-type multidrug transport system fused ATPase/permease subunit